MAAEKEQDEARTYDPPLIPLPVPEVIKAAALRGKLVIFVGAGVSRLAGGPSWGDFANEVLEQLCAKSLIDHAEIKQLQDYDPKTRLSIAKDICRDSCESIDYKAILQHNTPSREELAIFEHLISIGAPFVTTNFDPLLKLACTMSPGVVTLKEGSEPAESEGPSVIRKLDSIHQVTDLHTNLLYKPDHVIHLHGCLENYGGMVISTRDYLEHYSKPEVIEFLRVLFTEFTVLFVGYGLDELEILEYIFLKKPSNDKDNIEGQHYWLFPVFSYQTQLLKRLQKYYRNHCNVELVGFNRDKNNYHQLVNVVAAWAKEINYRPPGFSEKAKVIERAFDG